MATPTFNPASGSHSATPLNLTISTTTSDATIYYTTDGSDPTSSSKVYSAPIHIWFLAGKTVKARAIKTGLEDSQVATLSGVFSYPPLKSGAGAIDGYTLNTKEDGTTQNGVARSYTDNSNGTVTDTATGLVWQKCSQGLSGTNCETGTVTTANQANAGTYCSELNLAGASNWRLPSIQELGSLPDYGKATGPTIDTTAFPETPTNSYWSSTTHAPNTDNARAVSFQLGTITNAGKTNASAYRVRCVSGP